MIVVGLKYSALNLAATQRDNMRVLALLLGFAAVQAAAVRGKEQLSENPIRRIVNLLQMMAKEVEADGEKDEEMTEKCGGFDVIVFRSVSFGYLGVSYSICTCWNIEYWRAGRFGNPDYLHR